MIEGVEVAGGTDLDEVRILFREYAAGVGVDLCFQGFENELATLPGEYARRGALFLFRVDGTSAGCVAVHRWSDKDCEMKRLYVREPYLGLGLGRLLAERVINWAKGEDCERILLDTLPLMRAAQELYERLGFRDTAPYRVNPVEGARYMQLRLRSAT